ncbi:DNA-3-methyladenine glycosylase family protein [Flexibacterium corallicola]|uniref:DNA-3-methyladenine glycosylase family protein n=1 Tax=Flexibacterium corallicola TaxID=3037259 RepID=UPI00286F0784|nr:DNA-3-methyladenine glycosylase 2 family protein [Pseudovibrio sp. M1P-2-3]
MSTIEALERTLSDLQSLIQLDERLAAVYEVAGNVPDRSQPATFEGLSHIIVGQLLSVAAANSIWRRLQNVVVPFEPDIFLAKSDEELLGAGLSRAKLNTLSGLARELQDGLDLGALKELSVEEAHKRLCEIKGIGPWTADIFLLFCAGHPDIFPSGDVALQNAVQDAFGLDERPSAKQLGGIAQKWSPHRGVAARLLWSYYKARKDGRETMPV